MDIMQAMQDYAQRQKMKAVDQNTGVPGVAPSGPAYATPAASAPGMSQAQFSGYPGTKPGMTPQQIQQLLMLLQQRGMSPQAPTPSASAPV